MAQQSVLKATPIIYKVGEDITQERYNELVQAVGDWFSEIRNTKEPVKLAKMTIDACLNCVKPTDPLTTWDSASQATLSKRVRMACRYDMEAMKPLRTADDQRKRVKQQAKDRARAKAEEQKVDTNYPAEFRTLEPSYGEDPAVFFTSKELEIREQRRQAMVTQFPQLDNAAQGPKLDMLLDLQLLFERLRFRNAAAGAKKDQVKATEREMQEYTKQIVDLEKAMGIDPVSVDKMQKKKEGGSVGDAVRRFEEMGNYREIREKLFAEELILAYQMYMQPSPRTDMDGYQLDDVGLFAITKCRVVSCPKCQTKVFGGFSVEEIEAWLMKKGCLKQVEPNAGD